MKQNNKMFTPIMTSCKHYAKVNLVCNKLILKYCTDIYNSQYTMHTIFKRNKVSFGEQK